MAGKDKVQLGTTLGGAARQEPFIVVCSESTEHAVVQALDRLLAGEVVALPTETVYGLAGMASNPRALESIFEWKSRPVSDPLILHVFDISKLDKWTQINGLQRDLARRLAERFWPGPLTMVLEASPDVHPLIRAGRSTVALRSPSHPFFRLVLERLNDGVAAPSANVFGHISPTCAKDVVAEFPDKPLAVFDGGPCEVGIESTIVRIPPDGLWRVLRPGVITDEQIRAALGTPGQSAMTSERPVDSGVSQDHVLSPGQFVRHYAPHLPTYLLKGQLPTQAVSVVLDDGRHVALKDTVVLDYGSSLAKLGFRETSCLCYLNPDPNGDLLTFTRQLFAMLRRAEEILGVKAILIHFPDSVQNDWSPAVRDRIRRAASGIEARLSAQVFA